MSVYLCDFDDSFTYNIYSQLRSIGPSVEVLKQEDFKKELSKFLKCPNDYSAFVLGPGPGHPQEYNSLQPLIKQCLSSEYGPFIMGVCLGHQLIAQALGLEVTHCQVPAHGVTKTIELGNTRPDFLKEKNSITAQRYNSLCVYADENTKRVLSQNQFNYLAEDGELWMMWREDCISYQFHPESIGTSFRSSFFQPLKAFLL